MAENERITEAEWERRHARRECGAYGHDWSIIQTLSGPVRLTCARPCGDPGYVVMRDPDDPVPYRRRTYPAIPTEEQAHG